MPWRRGTFGAVMGESVKPVRLQPETVSAFDAYIHTAETAMGQAPRSALLWSDGSPDRVKRIQKGDVLAQLWSGNEPVKVPQGLIHDWIGAAFLPGVTAAKTVALVQNYDDHKNIVPKHIITFMFNSS
jgi:hypothetical protein